MPRRRFLGESIQRLDLRMETLSLPPFIAPCLSFPVVLYQEMGLRWAALPWCQRGFQEPPGTGTPAAHPSPAAGSAAPGWRRPGCPGSWRCPHQRCPVPAGERWHAGPWPCPALPGGSGTPGHPRATHGPPTGSPWAPRGPWLRAGQRGRAGTASPSPEQVPGGWGQAPGTALCVPRVGLGSGLRQSGAHPPVYLWGGWGQPPLPRCH